MNNHLHIVCLDAPSPPDYGGAIDMYYKIQALAAAGSKIIVHYFDYNSFRNTNGLENLCEAVYAYKRKSIFRSLPLLQPFIIQSRISDELVERLNKDDYPVLLEGLHCSGIIPFLNNTERVVIRMHNEEAAYYHHLAKTEHSFFKQKYFLQESGLLKSYQQKLDKQVKLACLSETDIDFFRENYGFHNSSFVPCFIPWQEISIKEGVGDYCLYHGNMLVSENEEASTWLLRNVFNEIKTPFIIAGKGISKKLYAEAGNLNNVSVITNPSISEIDQLIQNAHINVLPSMNSTGVKLKLLNALINGRFCITNHNGVKGSSIQKGVVVEDDAAGWVNTIKELMKKPFSSVDIAERKSILELYSNKKNAEKLIALYSHYL